VKKKINFRQALFTGFFVATIIAVARNMFDWESGIYLGIFAFIVTLAVSFIAQKVIKD
jgi:ABC-type tungstate transport system substrate-binding protein